MTASETDPPCERAEMDTVTTSPCFTVVTGRPSASRYSRDTSSPCAKLRTAACGRNPAPKLPSTEAGNPRHIQRIRRTPGRGKRQHASKIRGRGFHGLEPRLHGRAAQRNAGRHVRRAPHVEQGADAKGCGKGHIPPAIQHIEQFLCQFSALRIQHIREMPGQNRRPQCLNAQRVEIAAS